MGLWPALQIWNFQARDCRWLSSRNSGLLARLQSVGIPETRRYCRHPILRPCQEVPVNNPISVSVGRLLIYIGMRMARIMQSGKVARLLMRLPLTSQSLAIRHPRPTIYDCGQAKRRKENLTSKNSILASMRVRSVTNNVRRQFLLCYTPTTFSSAVWSSD